MKTVRTQYITLSVIAFILVLSFVGSSYAKVSSKDGYGSSRSEYKGPYNTQAHHDVNLYYRDATALADLRATIFQELLSWGMTPQGAAAVLGNIMCESEGDPTRTQSNVEWVNFKWGTTGLGLIQWTYWSLQADLFNTAEQMGKSWTDLGVQFEAMRHIFGPSESEASYLYTEGAGTAYELAGRFMDDFEKPALRLYDKRGNKATEAFNRFSGLPPESYSGTYDVGVSGSESSSGGAVNLSVVGEWDLHGMPEASGISSNLMAVRLPGALTDYKETENVEQIGSDISTRNQLDGWKTARSVIVFVGMVFILYALFLLAALILDNVNNFIDIEFISLFTFGAFHYTTEPDNLMDRKRFVSLKRMFVIIATIFGVGVCCVSGGIFSYVMRGVYQIVNVFG